jgi:hypothetical protein
MEFSKLKKKKIKQNIFKMNDVFFSCEILSPCGSNPCVHGTCHNLVPTSYQCVCEPGYTGKKKTLI